MIFNLKNTKLTIILFFFISFYPFSSYAINLKESENLKLDLDGVVKTYFIGMHLNYPYPVLTSLMNWDSRSGMMGIGEARLKFSGAWKEDKFKWNIMFKTSPIFSNQPNVMEGMAGGSTATYEPPRALPFQYSASESPQSSWYNEVDRFYFKYRKGKFDFIVGRQPIGLGVGFIWQPADILATFSPIEIDKEFKTGVDALRINIALGTFTELSLIGVAGGPTCRHVSSPDPDNPTVPSIWETPWGKNCSPGDPRFSLDSSSALTRFRTNFGKWDVGILGGWVRGDLMGGLFTSGNLDRFKIRGEITYTHDMRDDEVVDNDYEIKEDFVRAVLGFNYPFKTKKPFSLFMEFYYNGYGTDKTDDYLLQSQTTRTSVYGEVLNLGVFYSGLGLNWQPTYRVNFSFMTMSNILDRSFHISSNISVNISDNSSFVLGGFLPFGKTMDENGKIGSEFGIYPKMVYFQYKRYF
jgi:hypothetical protein